MAGGQERVLRRRIRSVQSTRKITKAMELIAASRIVRAQSRIAANRPYREGMERILRLTAASDPRVAELLRNGAEVTVWSVGKKAPGYFRYRGIEVAQSFTGFADQPQFSDAC